LIDELKEKIEKDQKKYDLDIVGKDSTLRKVTRLNNISLGS